MRYKTIIKITCDALDPDEASHKAGQYLKGELDESVDMRCHTRRVISDNFFKYFLTGVVSAVIFGFRHLR